MIQISRHCRSAKKVFVREESVRTVRVINQVPLMKRADAKSMLRNVTDHFNWNLTNCDFPIPTRLLPTLSLARTWILQLSSNNLTRLMMHGSGQRFSFDSDGSIIKLAVYLGSLSVQIGENRGECSNRINGRVNSFFLIFDVDFSLYGQTISSLDDIPLTPNRRSLSTTFSLNSIESNHPLGSIWYFD